MTQRLSADSKERKGIPLARGFLDYFPNAMAEVAKLSQLANEKHNPGQEMHWSFGKSNDHADCELRHMIDRGEIDDEDGLLHDVKKAWRAMADLETTLIARGAKPGRGVRISEEDLAALRGEPIEAPTLLVSPRRRR